MFKNIEQKKSLFITSCIFTTVLYVITNGYRFSNPMFSGDSLLMIHQNDSAWQIALGRFVQPFLVMLRGGIALPFLISVLTVTWLSLSLYFLADYLKIKKYLSVAFVSAAMVCNTTLLAANASFLQYTDFYAFALFLSVFGVWLLQKKKVIYVALGIMCLSLSLGIYQSYICVAIALVMMYFLFKMLDNPTLTNTLKDLLKHFIAFALSAVIYLIVWKIFQGIFDIWTANSYNGMASLGDYSNDSIFAIIGATYRLVAEHFMNPSTFTTMPFRGVSLSIVWLYILRFCNIVILLVPTISLIRLNRQNKTNIWQKLLQIAIILLFPLGINFVCIMSKGMVHTLMIYAFCLVYVLAIIVTEKDNTKKLSIPWLVTLSAVMIISWSNIVYSNQVYQKKHFQEQATLSLMTRIVYEIESTDGYIAGVTPVAISGSFEETPYIDDINAFEELVLHGMGKTSLTYSGTDYAFLNYIMNVNMNLTRISDENETVKQMPLYPAPGSVAYVDGILVIKISD